MLRKVVFGSGLVALLPVVEAAKPIENETARPPLVMKPSDLPIYGPPDFGEHDEDRMPIRKVNIIQAKLMEPVHSVRVAVQGVIQQTDSVLQSIKNNYNEVQVKSDWIVKYLREEENKEVRYGAVAMGGLTGFIFGLRGGFIRRALYATVGTSLMGAICFPEETKEVFSRNGVLAKQYINIAYNFAYGVKPGDPQLELKFPELHFPQNLSELVDLTTSMASSVKQVVMPPSAKEAPQEPAKEKKE